MLARLVVPLMIVASLIEGFPVAPASGREFTRLPQDRFLVLGRSDVSQVTRLEGKILAEDTAAPVAFALVEIQGPDGSSRIWKTLSNPRGEFSFPEVPQGTYRFKTTAWAFWSVEGDVQVSADADAGVVDLGLHRAWYSEQDFGGRCRWLAMLPGERIAVEHDSVRVPVVEGRVVGFDVSGDPISGVLIEVRGPDGSDRVVSALTDSLGRFRLAGVPEGRYVWKVTLFGFESILGDLVVDPEVTSEAPWEIILKPAG